MTDYIQERKIGAQKVINYVIKRIDAQYEGNTIKEELLNPFIVNDILK